MLVNPEDGLLSKEHVQPGTIIVYDFREGASKQQSTSQVNLLQWNIERGYKIEQILSELKLLLLPEGEYLMPALLSLQELDINCERTKFENIPKRLAQELKLQCVFVVEFIELPSSSSPTALPRTEENKIGSDNAFHGNATFSSCFDLLGAHNPPRVFPHSAGVDWETFGDKVAEPRVGQRMILHTVAQAHSKKRIHMYNLHLEVFCGALTRVRQIADAIGDAKQQRADRFMAQRHDDPSAEAVCIFGDMNTMAHSIVRLSRNYGTDRMRLLSLGENEAHWLARNFLNPSTAISHYYSNGHMLQQAIAFFEGKYILGLQPYELMKLSSVLPVHHELQDVSSHISFFDPFDLYHDVTLNHPKYKGFVQGKLDWALFSATKKANSREGSNESYISDLLIEGAFVGNGDYSMSDHKYLCLTVDVAATEEARKDSLLSWWDERPAPFWRCVVPFYLVRITACAALVVAVNKIRKTLL